MRAVTSRNESRGHMWRSRWAAIGAAVAVTFGAGGLVAVNAAGGVDSTTVLTDPVRVLDSRDPVNVGLAGPFASQVPQKLKITGSISTTTGTKTVVPVGATGVLLNVTAVAPSAAGFISIRPGDATGLPSTSSLNFTAGQIVPNAVLVALPTGGGNAGQIDITYDAFGASGPTTDILIDVVGYTSDAKLTELQAKVDAIQAVNATQQGQIDAIQAVDATQQSQINAVPKIAAAQQTLVPAVVPTSDLSLPFVGTWTITTDRTGPVLVHLEANFRMVCAVATDFSSWLLVDGATSSASSLAVMPSGAYVQVAFTEILNLSAGTHQLGIGTKCTSGSWNSATQGNLNGWALNLGAGTPISASLEASSSLIVDIDASGRCTITPDQPATCEAP